MLIDRIILDEGIMSLMNISKSFLLLNAFEVVVHEVEEEDDDEEVLADKQD